MQVFHDGAHRTAAAGYCGGLILLGSSLAARQVPWGRMIPWTAVNELAGFLLVAALIGWGHDRWRARAGGGRTSCDPGGTRRCWFYWVQAIATALVALVIFWILLDPGFAALGEGQALLGLAGHSASCPAALMLLGTAIVMAWQSNGMWRGGWQYAAMGAGVLFTSSIGWSRLDAASDTVWSRRTLYLLVSVVMMTLLTRFGLARVLPASGDWITRARRAAPVFGVAALMLAILALLLSPGEGLVVRLIR